MKTLTFLVMAVVCVCAPGRAQQQAAPQGGEKPAKYVYFESVKVNSGKRQAFARMMTSFRQGADTSAPDMHWIAASSITGEGGMMTFVTFQNSMADVEKFIANLDKAGQAAAMKDASMAADEESQGGSWMGLSRYDEELSYRPEMVSGAETRWWNVEVIGLRAGCEDEFNGAVKQVIDIHKKAGDEDHWLAYHAITGEHLPAVVFVTPMKSLAEDDREPNAAAKEAFDSPLVKKMFESVGRNCITSVENSYSRVEPAFSRPTQAMVAANPQFWTVKEASASQASSKKGKKAKAKAGGN
jgi:hypothetical protein